MRLLLDEKDRVVLHHFPELKKYCSENNETATSVIDRFQKWLLSSGIAHISSMTTKLVSLNILLQDFLKDN